MSVKKLPKPDILKTWSNFPFGFFNGGFGQIRKGLSTLGWTFEFKKNFENVQKEYALRFFFGIQ